MKLLILVPNVIRRFVANFPEVQNNAYKYFNYDNRVVNERVNRFDQKSSYKGPDDFTDSDYNELVVYAKTLINPILAKYNLKVANEDALNMAIRSYSQGLFDGKVNAGRFGVLLEAMINPSIGNPGLVMAKKEKSKEKVIKPKDTEIKPHVLKELGLTHKDIPLRQRVRIRQKGAPLIVREKGKHIVKK